MRTARRRPGVIIAVLVGIIGLIGAGTALAGTPAADKFKSQPLIPGTPCTVTAKACIDLDAKQSWLLKDGKIMTGPVPIGIGKDATPTPVGYSLRVYRKEQMYYSSEYRMPNGDKAPMPYAVFYDDGGIAFHEGNPDAATGSGGCIRLARSNAIAWFNYLQIGDQVQSVRSSQVYADRGIAPPQ